MPRPGLTCSATSNFQHWLRQSVRHRLHLGGFVTKSRHSSCHGMLCIAQCDLDISPTTPYPCPFQPTLVVQVAPGCAPLLSSPLTPLPTSTPLHPPPPAAPRRLTLMVQVSVDEGELLAIRAPAQPAAHTHHRAAHISLTMRAFSEYCSPLAGHLQAPEAIMACPSRHLHVFLQPRPPVVSLVGPASTCHGLSIWLPRAGVQGHVAT
jgi:hypothetical protein